jgi:hypothetical protein
LNKEEKEKMNIVEKKGNAITKIDFVKAFNEEADA